MPNTTAIRYHEHGKPEEVLQLETLDLSSPGPGEVQIRMLAAAIHPSDFGMIGGSYGRLRELPAVGGREGVGEIVSVGDGVTARKAGERVSLPAEGGTWISHRNVRVEELGPPLPEDVPIEQLALAMINPPTAWRLLHDFEYLGEGDWVIQNAANSAVGVAVIQLARHLGLKTLNVVRREELIEPLKAMGTHAVVTEGQSYWKELDELTGGKRPRLALNSIGGESAMNLIKATADGGVHVTFGAMTFETVRFPTRFLIFNQVSLTGFWLDHWIRQRGDEAFQTMMGDLYPLLRDGVLQTPVADTFALEQWREALAAAQQPRFGKVLFLGETA